MKLKKLQNTYRLVLLALFNALLITNLTNAQTTGITSYTATVFNSCPSSLDYSSQDNSGSIWYKLGCDQLVKFNGSTFTTYTFSYLPGNALQAVSSGVWCFSNISNELFFFNGSGLTDYTSMISSLLGSSAINTNINAVTELGSLTLFGTNKGLIVFNGVSFSIFTKATSNLNCDTIYTLSKFGGTTLLGTHQGICTFNGTTFSNFNSISGSSNKAIKKIFSNGTNAILTRKNPANPGDYYDYNGSAISRRAVSADSMQFTVNNNYSIGFIGTQTIIPSKPNSGYQFSSCKIMSASPVKYIVPVISNTEGFIYKFPGSTQKFYLSYYKSNKINVLLIDLTLYASNLVTGMPNQTAYLDTNQVEALISETNIKHQDLFGNGDAHYIVPKADPLKPSSIYASAIWIGGFDNSGLLHMSAQTYRQNGTDFWPGPIDTINGTSNLLTSAPYNRVWKNSCNQINAFASNFNAANFSINSTSSSFESINSYPANGNTSSAIANILAPFYDTNNNGIYEPSLGDYPIIKGHQQIYSIYNDAYGTHTESNGLPLGIEIHDKSFSYHFPLITDSLQVINYTTFNNYEIYNRSNLTYTNVLISFWSDCDLGNYLNDYVGTDTIENYAYCYNSSLTDAGYGNKLPMLAYCLIPKQSALTDGIDNNNNGTIDEIGENFKINFTSTYYNNIGSNNPATTNPTSTLQYYNYMKGIWKDGTPLTPSGIGYNPTSTLTPTNYMFSGNPQLNSGWTESLSMNSGGDRRLLCTIGPFTFPAKKKVELEIANVFSRDTSLNNQNTNLTLLKKDVRNVRHFQSIQNKQCNPSINVGIKENDYQKINLQVYPNPTKNTLIISSSSTISNGLIEIYDLSGRKVYEKRFKTIDNTIINIESIDPGVYIINVISTDLRLTNKFVKQ